MSQRHPKRPGSSQQSLDGFFAKRSCSDETPAAAAALPIPAPVELTEVSEQTDTPPDVEALVVSEQPEHSTAAYVKDALRGEKLSDSQKLQLIRSRKPVPGCSLPFSLLADKRKQSGTSKRFLQLSLFEKHEWLAYHDGEGDVSAAGVYCLPCVLFPTLHRGGSRRADTLITKVHRNFKKLGEDLDAHGRLEYHADSIAKLSHFISVAENPQQRIDATITERSQERVRKNRQVLLSILRCLELAGRQGLALRGHRDDLTGDGDPEGNFHALIRFAVASGDTVLHDHLQTCAKNATYLSNTAQNQLLVCMGDEITASIVKNVRDSHYYGIQADEVTDVSGWEQLGISVRYICDGEATESLVSFAECKSATGAAICDTIMGELKRIGLNPKFCRAQAYDGAGAMSGHLNGCQAKFSQVVPEAHYYHCASHQLNLALTKACAVKSVQCMLSDLQALGIFFKYSPKRQRCLETSTAWLNYHRTQEGKEPIPTLKLKLLSATRWVERHTAIMDFRQVYEAVVFCLEVICGQSSAPTHDQQAEAGIEKPCELAKFDGKSVTEANGLLRAISSDDFIVSLHCNVFVSAYLKGLSALLQGSHLDILEVYSQISGVVAVFQGHRGEADISFKKVYGEMCSLTAVHGREKPVIPRTSARQTQRSNVPASDAEEYWRRSVFVPFLDSVISEMGSRFSSLNQKAIQALLLLPANLDRMTSDHIANIEAAYASDLPDRSSFRAEVELWMKKWEMRPAGQHPTSLPSTVKETNSILYPNISCILQLVLVIPVTSAGVERANSTLKFIKTERRSTMTQSRLNALVLLHCHKSIPLDLDAVLNRFASAHPRRMLLVNPVQEESEGNCPDL